MKNKLYPVQQEEYKDKLHFGNIILRSFNESSHSAYNSQITLDIYLEGQEFQKVGTCNLGNLREESIKINKSGIKEQNIKEGYGTYRSI